MPFASEEEARKALDECWGNLTLAGMTGAIRWADRKEIFAWGYVENVQGRGNKTRRNGTVIDRQQYDVQYLYLVVRVSSSLV